MRKMIGFTLSLVFGGILFANPVFADRYIIKLSNSEVFQTLNNQLKNHQAVMGSFGGGPFRDGVQLFNTDADVTEALDQLELLVVESNISDEYLEQLSNNPLVEFIEKDVIIPAPKPVSVGVRLEPVALPITETPWGILAVRAPETWDAVGRGEGVRVMVLDTGIDRDHPAIAANFENGKNFVSASLDSPYDYFDDNGHGTHVAGTILADGETTGLVGVAPKARLLSGRVCNNQGCPTSSVLSGVNWAIEEGVDVVNMSLGGPFPSFAGHLAYERADKAGVMIVAATGNDGEERVSYPAAYDTVFAVGAVGQDLTKADFSNWGPELDIVAPGVDIYSSVPSGMGRVSEVIADLGEGPSPINSMPMEGSGVSTSGIHGEFVYLGLGKTEDFEGKDVKGKVALIQRGEISFGDKALNAIINLATAVVIFNNEDGLAPGTLGEGVTVAVPVVMIEKAVGEEIVRMLDEGQQINAMVGTFPSDYMEMQGTSMATPHVTGVAALVRGANPSLTPAEVRTILGDTAVPRHDVPASLSGNLYGRGVVDAFMATSRAIGADAPLRLTSN